MKNLEMNDAFIRTAFERCPAGLLVVDAAGRIVVANDEVERIFGYPRTALLGQTVELLLPGRFATSHVAQRKAFVGTSDTRRMGAGREVVARHQRGHELFVEVGLSAIATTEGNFTLATVVDVTARRELEMRVREAHKLEALGALATSIAHEFNNTLQGIIGYAELIRSAIVSDRSATDDLEVLLATARRGAALVKRIVAEATAPNAGQESTVASDVLTRHSSAPPPAPPTARRGVLLVDDEIHLVRLGQRILERANFDVAAFSSSERALEIFRANPQQFDLVITDNSMPELTGLELVGHIHRIRPDLPVIMVSGIGDALSLDELRRRGVRRLLSKPYLAADLCAAAFELTRPASTPPRPA